MFGAQRQPWVRGIILLETLKGFAEPNTLYYLRSAITPNRKTKMSKAFLFLACIVAGLLVLACAAPTNRNADAPSSPTLTTNRNDNSSGGDQIGIAECDNFINAYETCVSSKVPEAARANLRAAVTTWRTDWKKLADDPQTRGTLTAACQRQRETTMASMKAFNCTW